MTPTLVLGHPRDPIHPFSDAGMLAREMPEARLLEADSLIELRVQPERLTDEIAGFLDELWSPGEMSRNGRPAAAARGKRAARTKAPARPAKRTAAARARSTGRRRSAG
jgi:hypothetical protein